MSSFSGSRASYLTGWPVKRERALGRRRAEWRARPGEFPASPAVNLVRSVAEVDRSRE